MLNSFNTGFIRYSLLVNSSRVNFVDRNVWNGRAWSFAYRFAKAVLSVARSAFFLRLEGYNPPIRTENDSAVEGFIECEPGAKRL
jgi:hypothetical protein